MSNPPSTTHIQARKAKKKEREANFIKATVPKSFNHLLLAHIKEDKRSTTPKILIVTLSLSPPKEIIKHY